MRDLSKLARKIQMDDVRIIAIEQLGMDYTDINNIAADCGEKSYQFNFEILNKWWKRSYENNREVTAFSLIRGIFMNFSKIKNFFDLKFVSHLVFHKAMSKYFLFVLQKLATLLREAVDEGLVDSKIVTEILGVSPS